MDEVIEKPAAVAVVTIESLALAPLRAVEADIGKLAARYANVAFDVRTPAGMREAKKARQALREEGRFLLQRAAAAVKKAAKDAALAVDNEADRLIGLIQPREQEIHALIEAREQELEAEREKARQAEEARKAGHRNRIGIIRSYLAHARGPGMTAERIAKGIEQLAAMPIDASTFEEFAAEAEAARADTLASMRSLHEQVADNERLRAQLAAATPAPTPAPAPAPTPAPAPADYDTPDKSRVCDSCGRHPFIAWGEREQCPGVHEYGDCDGTLKPSAPDTITTNAPKEVLLPGAPGLNAGNGAEVAAPPSGCEGGGAPAGSSAPSPECSSLCHPEEPCLVSESGRCDAKHPTHLRLDDISDAAGVILMPATVERMGITVYRQPEPVVKVEDLARLEAAILNRVTTAFKAFKQ